MSRVLDGGAGEDRGGIEDKSIDSGDRGRFPDADEGEEAPDTGGELEPRRLFV